MNKNFIKIHNDLAMAKYRMTLAEQKLFIYAVKNINQEDNCFVETVFYVGDFARDTGLDLKYAYDEMDSMTTSIMRTVITIKNTEDEWVKYNLTRKCHYKSGKIIFHFNQEMKSFLLQLKEHYFLQDPAVITFKSWYSIRLYDIFKSQLYKNKDFIIELDELKEKLGLEESYKRFNNFREKVVDVAVSEINDNSDIKVCYEKQTQGRKVVGLSFHVETNIDEYLMNITYTNNVQAIRNKAKLNSTNFSDSQVFKLYECAIERFWKHRDEDDLCQYICINYQYTKDRKSNSNIYGYLKTCVENDYANAIPQILLDYKLL